MTARIIKRNANLRQAPEKIEHNDTHVSLGDLHGNTLKLIYTLIEEGILELKEDDDYDELVRIYNKPVDELTEEDISLFYDIVDDANVNKTPAITLIGDELADRGSNDYFTLLVLKKLKQGGANVDILLSNHGAKFLKSYEKDDYNLRGGISMDQSVSVHNMQHLINQGFISKDEVDDLVKENYLPMLKAISYSINEEGEVTLFSHTPIGLETIQGLAASLEIDYDDSDPEQLFNTIDRINGNLQTLLEKKKITEALKNEGAYDTTEPISPTFHPFNRLIWNRFLGKELIAKPINENFKINFVYGHVGNKPVLTDGTTPPTHQSIDTLFGKGSSLSQTNTRDVVHLTRHSDDYLPNELTTSLLNRLKKKRGHSRHRDDSDSYRSHNHNDKKQKSNTNRKNGYPRSGYVDRYKNDVHAPSQKTSEESSSSITQILSEKKTNNSTKNESINIHLNKMFQYNQEEKYEMKIDTLIQLMAVCSKQRIENRGIHSPATNSARWLRDKINDKDFQKIMGIENPELMLGLFDAVIAEENYKFHPITSINAPYEKASEKSSSNSKLTRILNEKKTSSSTKRESINAHLNNMFQYKQAGNNEMKIDTLIQLMAVCSKQRIGNREDYSLATNSARWLYDKINDKDFQKIMGINNPGLVLGLFNAVIAEENYKFHPQKNELPELNQNYYKTQLLQGRKEHARKAKEDEEGPRYTSRSYGKTSSRTP